MDFIKFLRLLSRYKWALIFVPIICAAITYFLVKNLPQEFGSQAQISTGLLDPSKKVLSDQTVDYYKVSLQFNNIMEKMRMKRIINILSYNVVLHDLEQPAQAFREYSKQVDSLGENGRNEVIEIIKRKLNNKEILTLADNKDKYKIYDLIQSMGYGEDTFRDELNITHSDNSDLINIDFVSENAELSAFVVNTYAKNFIINYSSDVNVNQGNSMALLDSLLRKKEQVMNEKNQALASFKRTKGVLNLEEQSATVYSQISEYEAQRLEALKTIQSNQGAIAIIEGKIRGNDPLLGGSSRSDNREILNLKKQLEVANAKWIDGNFKASDQKRVDSLTRILTSRSAQNSDDNTLDPRASKQSLVAQKLNLEVATQQAKSSIKTLTNQINILRGRYQSMVPFDADIQNYQREAELATKEYMGALDQFNQSNTDQKTGLRLEIAQLGLPGNPEPSKQVIYIAGAGFAGLMLCLSVLFGMFFMDASITTPYQLELATKSRVIGSVNLIEGADKSVRNLWNDKSENDSHKTFKEYLRSIRFEINTNLEKDGSKILGVTSIGALEGKTFMAYSLAYAFAMTGKKILLIADEQHVAFASSKELSTSQNFQTFLVKKEVHVEDLITVMNKNTEKNSLLEIQNINNLKLGFEVLRKEFDLIIIDINSLSEMNIAKEWLMFTEKNIAVFESGGAISDDDKQYVKYIKDQPGFIGWIFNKLINSNKK